MPAEQDYLDQLERYYGVRSDNDSHNLMLLLDRVRQLEAELLAAQERIAHLTQQRDGHAADRLAAEEREKALRDVAERFIESPVFSPLAWQEEFRRALAGSPSEKPGSGQNHPPITSSNPKAKRELADAD